MANLNEQMIWNRIANQVGVLVDKASNGIAEDKAWGENFISFTKGGVEYKIELRQLSKAIPETVDEVKSYMIQKRVIDPNYWAKKFFDYYEARDWTWGKGQQLKNWKLAVVSWINKKNGIPVMIDAKTKRAYQGI